MGDVVRVDQKRDPAIRRRHISAGPARTRPPPAAPRYGTRTGIVVDGKLKGGPLRRLRSVALKALFRTYVGSSNRSSLSLLSEPIVSDQHSAFWKVRSPSRRRRGVGVAGWVNTGDAELLSPADLAHWQAAYAPELSRVRALALPHHGSDRNSDQDLQALTPTALLVAHVKSTSSKHPGATVMTAAGTRLTRVTEDVGSAVTMSFYAP